MARPRKWQSDAERMRAKRRVNEQEQPSEQRSETCSETSGKPETPGKPGDAYPRYIGPTYRASVSFVHFRDCPEVPHDPKDWMGRGVVRDWKGRGYVLVSRGRDMEHGVVTEEDWLARLEQRCAHGRAGWSCHAC